MSWCGCGSGSARAPYLLILPLVILLLLVSCLPYLLHLLLLLLLDIYPELRFSWSFPSWEVWLGISGLVATFSIHLRGVELAFQLGQAGTLLHPGMDLTRAPANGTDTEGVLFGKEPSRDIVVY